MKSVRITRKIAFLLLSMIICISSVIYFQSSAVLSYVNSFEYVPVRGNITLIIDPGHGGADGGAVSAGGTTESSLNLDISLKIEQICGFLGVPSAMTRKSEDIAYPDEADTIKAMKNADQKQRLELINSTQNAVLISIHQNFYTSPKPYGAQVFYAPTDGSCELGKSMQLAMKQLNENNKRSAELIPGSIYLMNNINCPAILIECGFISNPNEESLLKTPEYQLKIAALTAACYVSDIKLLEDIYGG